MSESAESPRPALQAEQQLDGFAAELEAYGFEEFLDSYMPHRVVIGESPLPASEIYGIRHDDEVGGFEVDYRDMGVKRTLMRDGSWEQARTLCLAKVREMSPGRSGTGQ